MKPELIYLFDDLPDVAVITTSLLPGAEACAIHLRGVELIKWLRLPGGFLCITENQMETPGDSASEALGRMVAYQTLEHCDYAPEVIHDIVHCRAEAIAELGWDDLPSVKASPARTQKGITRYKLQSPGHTAVVMASHDPGLPLVTVLFSDGMPPRSLAQAIGRTLLSHHRVIMALPVEMAEPH